MIRGLRFKIPNNHSKFFKNILRDVDVDSYTWYVDYNQVFRMYSNEFLFKKNRYTGRKFNRLISIYFYYVNFIKLIVFNDREDYKVINTYEDFANSNCQMVILCSDSENVNIYCKDEEIIELMKQRAVKHKYQEIEYITDENDSLDQLIPM